MMQQWAAISIVVILGIFMIVLLVILQTFTVYTKVLTKAHAEILDMRINLAKQDSDRAALAVLHHRRRDDPPLIEEKEA